MLKDTTHINTYECVHVFHSYLHYVIFTEVDLFAQRNRDMYHKAIEMKNSNTSGNVNTYVASMAGNTVHGMSKVSLLLLLSSDNVPPIELLRTFNPSSLR